MKLAEDFETKVVQTVLGKIRGKRNRRTRVTSFLGVPYAAPPVGLLRWRPPQEHAGWLGIRDAFWFGPDCPQVAQQGLRGSGMSEDCLYLNIWSPDHDENECLPVLVWIHGDGWVRGSGSHIIYDGEALAAHGAVVITINYRLGVAGFLAHPELSRESENSCSGNYALLDQIHALSWIGANVRSFGGDPALVTTFGQSAGGTCISMLMASPLAEGLFSRAILQSPGCMRPLASLREAEEAGILVGTNLKSMREVPIAELQALVHKLVPSKRSLTAARRLGPIVDNFVILADEATNYAKGEVRAMPLIIGTAANEGRRLSEQYKISTVEEYEDYLRKSFPDLDILPPAYRACRDEEVVPALAKIIGDTQFSFGAWKVAQGMTALGGDVYQYLLSHWTDGQTGLPGHDDELPYVFGTLPAGGLRWSRPENLSIDPVSRELSERLMAAWVRFARLGSPERFGPMPWPKLNHGCEIMELKQSPRLICMPRTDDLSFIGSIREVSRKRSCAPVVPQQPEAKRYE